MNRPALPPSGFAIRACLLGLLAVLAWDRSGLDLPVAHLAADARGFALKDHWLLSGILHQGAQRIGWLCVGVLVLAVAWPWGPLRSMPRGRRLQWSATALAAVALVAILKAGSTSSCPWDLQDFGGVARYASHWSRLADGGPGRCFPAGHATTGFAFVGGYFALRGSNPASARWALGVSLAAGAVLGLAQQWRGAHFTSHTLWSAWLCWTVAWVLDTTVGWEQPR